MPVVLATTPNTEGMWRKAKLLAKKQYPKSRGAHYYGVVLKLYNHLFRQRSPEMKKGVTLQHEETIPPDKPGMKMARSVHLFSIHHPDEGEVGHISVSGEGHNPKEHRHLYVHYLEMKPEHRKKLDLRGIAHGLHRHFPNAKMVSGHRITGRHQGENDYSAANYPKTIKGIYMDGFWLISKNIKGAKTVRALGDAKKQQRQAAFKQWGSAVRLKKPKLPQPPAPQPPAPKTPKASTSSAKSKKRHHTHKSLIWLFKGAVSLHTFGPGISEQHHTEHPFHKMVEAAGFKHWGSAKENSDSGNIKGIMHNYDKKGSKAKMRLESFHHAPSGRTTHEYTMMDNNREMHNGSSKGELKDTLKLGLRKSMLRSSTSPLDAARELSSDSPRFNCRLCHDEGKVFVKWGDPYGSVHKGYRACPLCGGN